MSGAGSDLARGDRYRSGDSSDEDQIKQLQERASHASPLTIGTMAATSGANNVHQVTEQVSIAQRMVSATCGSILTSLLGAWRPYRRWRRTWSPSRLSTIRYRS